MHYSSSCSTQLEQRQLSVQLVFQSSTFQLPLGGMTRNAMVLGIVDEQPTLLGWGAIIYQSSCSPRNSTISNFVQGRLEEDFVTKGEGFIPASILYRRQASVNLL